MLMFAGLQLLTAEDVTSFVPAVRKVTPAKGRFVLTNQTRILYQTRKADSEQERSLAPLANVFSEELEILTGHRPQVLEATSSNRPKLRDILLRFSEIKGEFAASETDQDQSYRLDVKAGGVLIDAQYYKGVAYGTATLLQAIAEKTGSFDVPCMIVEDAPTAQYRSVMIDVARQPHSLGVLRDVIRLARIYKLRYIQLHLTDDQGFTFPFALITDNLKNNHHYTRKELEDLVAYADARGVTLIPEMDMPGHSSKVRESGYLGASKNDADVASPENFEKINAVIDDMLGVFKSSPYFHIGGDESGAGDKLIPFLAAMNDHLRKGAAGGKRRMIVWEGFHGAPTKALPATGDDRIIVMSWESRYNAPWDLLEAGYQIINASWKPMYIVGGGAGSMVHPGATGGRKFNLKDIYHWNKDIFMHWEPGTAVYEDRGPNDENKDDGEWDARWIQKQDQIIGGQMEFWEQHESAVLWKMSARLAVMSERLWNPSEAGSFAAFEKRAKIVSDRVMPIVLPIEILPPFPSEDNPITDIYQPYTEKSIQVVLRNRTEIDGTIRYSEGAFSNDKGLIGFRTLPPPDASAKEYKKPIEKSGGFGLCAQLFRKDGTAVDGYSWRFFNNWPDIVEVTDYDIGRKTLKTVIDLATLPAEKIKRRFKMPVLRGLLQHTEIVGQMVNAVLTVPKTEEYEIGMKTQSGIATLYLDLNQNGKWDESEKLIANTPPTEVAQTVKVQLKASEGYPLRIDHMTAMPRPVLTVNLKVPGEDKPKGISEFLSLPKK